MYFSTYLATGNWQSNRTCDCESHATRVRLHCTSEHFRTAADMSGAADMSATADMSGAAADMSGAAAAAQILFTGF